MSRLNPQARAQAVLLDVFQGYSLTEALQTELQSSSTHKALIQELCYGTLRWYDRLSFTLQQLMPKPLKEKDLDIEILLLLGLYQLRDMKFPAAVSVMETVNAVTKPWAKGLVNAVLRNYLRQTDALIAAEKNNETAFFSHPQWMLNLWKKAWPEHWQTIAHANNERPQMSLRINLSKISKLDYLALLKQHELLFQDVNDIASAVILEEAKEVEDIPGFSQGLVSIQDLGAQYLMSILPLEENLKILDACSAPGGKLSHLLETAIAPMAITAVEIDELRLVKIKQNLKRLDFKGRVDLHCADILEPETWWDGVYYDRIIADVPCSATGVIRRHPDIKLLRRASDLKSLAETQEQILQTLWSTLAPDGILIYITCSVCPEENEQVIKQFLETTADAECLAIEMPLGLALKYGHQCLPGLYAGDGFYYARLKKR